MARQFFTRADPPKSGKALKLWKMFTNAALPEVNKPTGTEPDSLFCIRPGWNQRAAGAAQYDIQWNHNIFWCYDAEDTFKRGIGDQPLIPFSHSAVQWYI